MRRWVWGLLVAVAALLVGVAGQQSAQAATNGTITGKVTTSKGAAAQYVTVYAYTLNGSNAGYASTDSSGNYSLSIAPGDYKLQFASFSSQYLGEFWDNKSDMSSADTLKVEAGKSLTANASLDSGGTVTGKVTGGDGSKLDGGSVYLYRATDSYWYTSTSIWNGVYTFSNIPAGSYKIRFSPPAGTPWLQEFYDDKKTLAEAQAFTVANEATVTRDAQLAKGAVIKGTVTDANGALVSYPQVYVYESVDGGTGSSVGNVLATEKGEFQTSGLPPGSYKVQFGGNSTVVGEWWDDKGSAGSASVLTVDASDVTLNPVLALAGQISGTVVGPDGKAVSNVRVSAAPASGESRNSQTDSSGKYTITGLAAGQYTVEFEPNYMSATDYATQWYKGAANRDGSTPVAVTAGGTTGGIDAKLFTAGSIAGTVTGSDGKPIPGASVQVQGPGAYRSTTTGADGKYLLKGLSDGDYTVAFYSPYGSLWWSEYYNNKRSSYDADKVSIVNRSAVTGIDAALAQGARISGKVTDASGPLMNASITAYTNDGSNGNMSYGTNTSQDGTWSMLLPAGSYTLRFSGSGYVSEYWNNVIDRAAATSVTLAGGDQKTGFDAVLDKGASISGTVTARKGSLPWWAWVSAYRKAADGTYPESSEASTNLSPDGKYTLAGLPAGTYKLQFSASYPYQSEWWDDKPDLNSASEIVVSKQQVITGKDAVLSKGASITGKLVDKHGNPISGGRVEAGWNTAYSNPDGTFEVEGLTPGTHRASFYANGYLSQYYKGKSDYDEADPITVARDEVKDIGTITLAKAASITGTIQDAVSKAPVAGVNVRAYTEDGDWRGSAITDQAGAYTMNGLTGGSYRIRLEPPDASEYALQWLDGVSSIYGSKRVDVPAEATVTANGLIKRGATISGIVKTSTGTPLQAAVVKVPGPGGGTATTGADGRYSISGVAPGKHKVSFAATGYWKQWYNGQPAAEMADMVTVDFGTAASGVDAVMTNDSFITGTVKGPDGKPLVGARVEIYRAADMYRLHRVVTDGSGVFRSKSLEPGKYDVFVPGSSQPSISAQWYSGADDRADATSVTVTAEKPSVIAMNMTAAGSVSGKVTGPSGAVPYARVSVFTDDDDWYGGYSQMDGTYTVGGLPAGKYKVYVWPGYNGSSLVPQYYRGKYDPAVADLLTVDRGKAVTGIDFALNNGGSIGGTVKGTDGKAANTSVSAYRKDGPEWTEYRSTSVGMGGTYTLGSLPPGDYKLSAGGSGYQVRWWNGKQTLETADVTTVVGQGAVTGRDFVLPTAPAIKGKVTTSDSQPITWGYVEAYTKQVEGDDEYWDYYRETDIRPDGTYTLNVPAGSYKVRAYVNGYRSQWFNGAQTVTQAEIVTLGGADAAGKDFVMQRGSTISGTVTFPAGDTTGAQVTVFDAATGDYVDDDVASAADPTFSIAGLAPGTYKLRFRGRGVLTEWWQDKYSEADATQIVLAAGKNATGLAVTLGKGATISGTVANAGKRPLPASVEVYDQLSGDYIDSRRTDPDGKYVFASLPGGSYLVRFDPLDRDYAPQWYQGALRKAGATPISLAPQGSAVADAVIGTGVGLTGKITDDKGNKLVGAGVTVDTEDGQTRNAVSNVHGVYTFTGLPEGPVLVTVRPSPARLDLLPVKDTKVDLVAGKNATLNAALAQGATVSGAVKDQNGKPVLGIGVDVYNADTEEKSLTAWTASDGTYRSSGLPAGKYKVRFKPGYYGGAGLVEQWWQGKDTFAGATTVTLSDKQQLGGIGATLKPVGGATPPDAPTAVTAAAGDGQVKVSWTAPAKTGGLAITKYEVMGAPTGYCETLGQTSCTVDVENNISYTFTVKAFTAAGASPWSAASTPVTPTASTGKPAAPKSVTATAGVQSASVSWAAVADATRYTVTTWPDNKQGCTATGTSCLVSGLKAGTAYRFTVVASNAKGDSDPSAASNSVVPTAPVVGAPAPPASVTATAGIESATVNWAASATATGYRVTTWPDNKQGCTSNTTTCVVPGLTAGKTYTFTVVATNASGSSANSSASNAVVPTAKPLPKPAAPGSVTAVAGVESATVNWGPVATAVKYTVTTRPGNVTGCTTTGTSCKVSGLTAGRSYTFTVVATNASGDSPASAPSNAVTPTAPPNPGGGGTGGGGTGGGGPVDPGAGGTGGGPEAPKAPAVAPAAKAKVKGKKANMTWQPVPGATSYQVRIIKGKKAGPWKTTSKPSFGSKLKKGKYVMEIRAVNAGGPGPIKRVKFKIK